MGDFMTLLDTSTIILISIIVTLFYKFQFKTAKIRYFYPVLGINFLISLHSVLNYFAPFKLYNALIIFFASFDILFTFLYFLKMYLPSFLVGKDKKIIYSSFVALSIINIIILVPVLLLARQDLDISSYSHYVLFEGIAFSLFYIFAGIALKTQDKFFIITGFILEISALISSFLFNYDVLLIGLTLKNLFLFNAVLSNTSYFDINFKNYNRIAFKEVYSKKISKNKSILFVRLNEVPSAFTSLSVKRRAVYKIKKNLFVLVLAKKDVPKVLNIGFSFCDKEEKINPSYTLYLIDNIDYEKFKTFASLISASNSKKEEKIIILNEENTPLIFKEYYVLLALRKALKEKTLAFKYQPIYSLEGKISSCEVLARMEKYTPDEFIPVAEKYGLEREIAILAFLESIKLLNDTKLPFVSFNISKKYMASNEIVSDFKKIIAENNLNSSSFNIEITESEESLNDKALKENMQFFKDKGFKFSVDDFGTGYSNMVNILHLNFDIIKIDKSILWSYFKENDQKAKIMLDTCIKMAKELDKKIVVEGVETDEMRKYLIKSQVDYMQGYLYSYPLELDALKKLLETI